MSQSGASTTPDCLPADDLPADDLPAEYLPAWPSQTRQPGDPPEQEAVNQFALSMRRALDAAVRARPETDVWRQAQVHAQAIEALLGQQSNAAGRSRSRTAYLNVNYRRITPIGVRLDLAAHFVSEQGRRPLLVGTAHHEQNLVADAEGLFIALRADQP